MVPHGKVCYLQIPAVDVEVSAQFYAHIFGWRLRRRGDGTLAFDDVESGGVSGTWVTDRPPAKEPGVLVWMMVDDVASTLDAIVAAGGAVVQPITPQGPGEFIATFADPAGNVLGVGQE
jgi:predicted enzyme related to lactoylglutathione lyase